MTPREVFERLVAGVSAGRWDELPGLYAEDTVVVHPLARPTEPLVGREALRRHFAAGAAMGLELAVRDAVVHETADPEVVIGEFAYEGRVLATGRTFRIPNVFVLRVRDGGRTCRRRSAGDVRRPRSARGAARPRDPAYGRRRAVTGRAMASTPFRPLPKRAMLARWSRSSL